MDTNELLSKKLLLLLQDLPRLRKTSKYKLTQKQIAKHLEMTPGTIQRYEKDSYMNMSVNDLLKLIALMESTKIKIKI